MPDTAEDLISTRWSLISRLKDWDDQESWRQFFDSYWRLIYGVAIKSGLTHVEAQDVVQETIVSVSKNMKTFRADPSFGSFKSWLLNLTRWRITDQVRRRGREVHLPVGGHSATADSSGTRPEERLPDPDAGFDKIWEQEWEHHVIEQALEKVKQQSDARHYQVFYLNAIKQVPAARVAELLNIHVDQVYLIKHRLAKVFAEGVQEVETPSG
jgi:RNA polymerase sigma-70 factor (ECF subfamily)